MLESLMFKKIELWVVLLLAIAGLLGTMSFGWAVRHHVLGDHWLGSLGDIAVSVTALPGKAKEIFINSLSTETKFEKFFLQPSRGQGSGVVVNSVNNDDLILMSGAFEGGNELRLIERDGTVVARWPVSYTTIFPDTSFLSSPPNDDLSVDTHGALIEPDGSIVFNFDYAGTAKLSKCGSVIWSLKHPTHHSIEPAETGGYWVPGRITHKNIDENAFPPFSVTFGSGDIYDDIIMRVSADGIIMEQISVTEVLYRNNLESVLTATGYVFDPNKPNIDGIELVHLNKIEELNSKFAEKFPDFKTGDLALSLRQQNLIIVVDPKTWKVRWRQTGPWVRQHDPEFTSQGTISVFDNAVYRTELKNGKSDPTAPRVSNITTVEPSYHSTKVIFGLREGQELYSVIRGKHEVKDDGGLLITEFEAGRVIETDAGGNIVWEYVNFYDDENVAEITEARSYPRSYFTVDSWACG